MNIIINPALQLLKHLELEKSEKSNPKANNLHAPTQEGNDKKEKTKVLVASVS